VLFTAGADNCFAGGVGFCAPSDAIAANKITDAKKIFFIRTVLSQISNAGPFFHYRCI
jgi:hypothetical protein